MPVEFLSDEQAAGFASFQGAPTRTELEKYFFLDDADREAIESRRRDHNRLGFAVQLGVARFLRRFLPDPRQVPVEVVDYLAQQRGARELILVYGDNRRITRFDDVAVRRSAQMINILTSSACCAPPAPSV